MHLANDPLVIRLLSVPNSTTFYELHRAIGVALGWPELPNDYVFQIGGRYVVSPNVLDQAGTGTYIRPTDQLHGEAFFDGNTSLVAAALGNQFNGRTLKYRRGPLPNVCDHEIEITEEPSPYAESISCFGGYGQCPAEGTTAEGWRELKAAYLATNPTA
jgi:hypothetical protein